MNRLRLGLYWLLRLALLAACGAGVVGRADIRLPAIFGSGMVLQRDRPIPVWGWASPGEKVSVDFDGGRGVAEADAGGRWRVELPAHAAGGPYTLRLEGDNRVTIENVLVGEVWLCSGQSNMTLPVAEADRAREEIAAASFPAIRLFTVARAATESAPQADCRGQWVECSPKTVSGFSAVAYYFGRALHRRLGVPIGLIHSSWGGTKAEAWMPRDTLAADPEFNAVLERWRLEVADFPRAKAEFEANRERLLAEWKVTAAAAKAAGRTAPAEPRLRTGPNTQYAPGALYNAMIAPLAPFALRGVIWYQGEANVTATALYRRLFPALIGAWRSTWGQADLPFLYVQLPNLARQPEPSRSGWAEMREAQLLALSVPRTAMAVTIDIGDPQNLHPPHKQPVGERLALAAGTLVYGLGGEGNFSPTPRSHGRENGAIRVGFTHAPGGLATRDGAAPRGFVLAGEDRIFFPATGRLEGDEIVLTSPQVPQPVAARYAWADNPDANLTNQAGLPVSPFRTDDWPTPGQQPSIRVPPR